MAGKPPCVMVPTQKQATARMKKELRETEKRPKWPKNRN